MADPRVVRFYLHKGLKDRAERGDHNFILRFSNVLRAEGFEVRYHSDSLAEQLKSRTRPGHSVFLMEEPTTPRGVTMRLNYFFPFWNIERTSERWRWPVAEATFDPATVPADEARGFARFWRKRLHGDAPDDTRRDGFVYAPLQGRLLTHRSFQSCSPLDMLRQLLAHDDRPVVATLHPKESYTDDERGALAALAAETPRLSLREGGMTDLLRTCDYVATQNSSVALQGYFFRKPAVLFGRIDFHHIAARVHDLGPAGAIAAAPDLTPDYDAYLWWFLQHRSINAGKPDAEDRIRQALHRAGWL